jgi:hypothetical protein
MASLPQMQCHVGLRFCSFPHDEVNEERRHCSSAQADPFAYSISLIRPWKRSLSCLCFLPGTASSYPVHKAYTYFCHNCCASTKHGHWKEDITLPIPHLLFLKSGLAKDLPYRMQQEMRYIIDEHCRTRAEETHAMVRGRRGICTPSDQFLDMYPGS